MESIVRYTKFQRRFGRKPSESHIVRAPGRVKYDCWFSASLLYLAMRKTLMPD
jgi:hypothetical protein